MRISRNLRPMVAALAVVALCACSSVQTNREQARKQMLAGKSCPEKAIVYEHPEEPIFSMAGCGMIASIEATCDGDGCVFRQLSVTRFLEPQRLRRVGLNEWSDPDLVMRQSGLTSEPPATVESKIVGGKLLTDVTAKPHKPMLPREINLAGTTVWGLYKICVADTGQVKSVKVVKTAMSGGIDGEWVSKIETWRYRPYSINGKPVPFCYTLRLAVASRRL